jgi:predicted dehydrogenase
LKEIGIGLIGTGFARSSQAPAFRAIGAPITAVCSGRIENARRTAAEFGIPHVCENHEQLIARDDVSLVVVSVPPSLHHRFTLDALAAGKHVLCEKPMAMDAREAREMTDLAASRPRQLALIDHELRFNPTWRRLKELVEEDYLGELYHVTLTIASGFRHSAERPWNWWADRSAGGGLLGALGSHAVDALRWIFGEIEAVAGAIETVIPARKDPQTGSMRAVETDDYSAFLARFAPRAGRRAQGVVLLSAVYASGGRNRLTAAGSRGTLLLEDDETLSGALGFNASFEDLSVKDPARDAPGIPSNIWARSFYHLAQATVAALREGKTEVPPAATFDDGLRCQQVLDAIRRAHRTQRWETVEV